MRKACIVTGGSSGIGREVALALHNLNHDVAVIDRNRPAHSLSDILFLEADLTDESAAKQAFDACMERFGRLDIAINAAGVFGPLASLDLLDDKQLDHVTFGNIRMCFHAMREELKIMRPASKGRIVNVASVAGSNGLVLKGDYCAAKHAIIGLTKTAALENVKFGVSVNSVSPGFVDTPMTAEAVRDNALLEKFIAKQTPLGRSLPAGSVASLIVWLTTDAPPEITGSDFVIDGCYSAR